MKNISKILAVTLVLLTLIAANAYSAEDATKIMEKSSQAYYYAGDDGRAKVTMTLTNKRGKERKRVFTMLRLDAPDSAEQKYYIYFYKPSDVKKTTFMVHKKVGEDDSRWLYLPALNMVKRIAASDKHSSFIGSDFSYEDVSGRAVSDDTHELLREDKIGDYDVYVIKSTPKEKETFSNVIHYIDKKTLLPIKREYFNKKGKAVKLFDAQEIKIVADIPTVTKRRMTNLKKNHNTLVEFTTVEYNVGIKDKIFSERYLKKAPKKWIK